MPLQAAPHQEEAAEFLASRYHAACGDEPGLGKTLTAIRAARLVNARSILVTCPASVRTSWAEHVANEPRWGAHWDLISYNGACNPAIRELGLYDKYDVWIGDEIHFCKNLESQRTKAILGKDGLARRARYKWPLSGTMAPNGRPVELYPMLKTLAPEFKDYSFASYVQRYCGAFWDGRGLNVKGATRIDELAGLLGDFMIRRTKRGVYPDRKEPLVSRVPLELTDDQLSEVRYEEDAIGMRPATLSSAAGGMKERYSQLGDTSRLLRLLGEAMVGPAVEFIEDKLRTVEKVVVFAHHLNVIAALERALAEYGVIKYVGGMGDVAKEIAVRQFAGPHRRVFLGQRQAAGTGINGLQKVCSTAVIVEPSWVPGETEQLIDRLDRMGQEDDLVNAYILYARGTLSAGVVGSHDAKDRTRQRLIS